MPEFWADVSVQDPTLTLTTGWGGKYEGNEQPIQTSIK